MPAKTDNLGFCVDYLSPIDKHLIQYTWAIANPKDNVVMIGGAQLISVADVQSAYWKILVHPDHVESTAFVTNSGKYCYTRMPLVFVMLRGILQKWYILHRTR